MGKGGLTLEEQTQTTRTGGEKGVGTVSGISYAQSERGRAYPFSNKVHLAHVALKSC